ncbi:hypothetical protein TGAM01_v202948 [Trichoderma gamsii]|uniref:Uncharacterized protein n=1 Tax=Trichoderma gamsii TaxID=398673 RepID=A0A2P4ZVX2_9HYPO|nr:hypothetical protein TGAM01_v202948 [Trichoderma gamsii]PON28454.1 hypothetical protein TGAM01_v202948 [Trichoderma gamsii]
MIDTYQLTGTMPGFFYSDTHACPCTYTQDFIASKPPNQETPSLLVNAKPSRSSAQRYPITLTSRKPRHYSLYSR